MKPLEDRPLEDWPLEDQVNCTWTDLQELVTRHPTSFGPPELLRFELGELRARIDEASSSDDDGQLQRCLEQVRSLAAKLKCLLPGPDGPKPSPSLNPNPDNRL